MAGRRGLGICPNTQQGLSRVSTVRERTGEDFCYA
jgi:hypothetical protein